ncbi:FAD-linked sulfhydryl oxidase ALR [Trichoplax sp. H2]|nr:FAD-linked sulfhydryl oxidase ALR [Trichoplax sp. H2]|eukprot:RDD42064.1 FAD-linked sulfhydryl oxidase ALR [Trichoplax sp. H2]
MDAPRKCRACSDFKSWAGLQETQATNQKHTTKPDPPVAQDNKSTEKKECPLFLGELGRSTWGFLHTMAAYYPDNPSPSQKEDIQKFMHLFSKFFPCDDCATHLRSWMKDNPPQAENQDRFSKWMCYAHNEVNGRLGKKLFDCSKVNERWRDGWKDGSCD